MNQVLRWKFKMKDFVYSRLKKVLKYIPTKMLRNYFEEKVKRWERRKLLVKQLGYTLIASLLKPNFPMRNDVISKRLRAGNEEELDVDDRRIYREAHGHLSHYNSGYSSKWKESEMVFPKRKIRGE